MTRERKKQSQELNIAEEKLEACLGAFPERPSRFPFFRHPVRLAYRNYSDARIQIVSIKTTIQRLDKARDLYATWIEEAKKRGLEIDKGRERRDSVQAKLMDLKSALSAGREGFSTENLLKQKSLSEVYVGVLTEDEKDVTFVQPRYWELPSARDDFKEFLKANKITDQDSLDEFNTNQLQKLFMQYARKRLKPATDLSVLEVLRELERRKEGTISEVITQAVKNSSLLLPIDDDKLAGKQRFLVEFAVIGGEDRNELQTLLEDRIPTSPYVHLWASTGDKYRITICNYFGAIPLYMIEYLKDIRSYYLKAGYSPPPYTDRHFLLGLPDIIPDNDPEANALKLLSLAILRVNETPQEKRFALEQEALIVRRRQRDGSACHRIDPIVFRSETASEDQLWLPDGFYQLYERICKDAQLRKRLTETLLDLSKEEGFGEALTADIVKKYTQYKKFLDGSKEQFGLMATGLYRQHMFFYQIILKKSCNIEDLLCIDSG